MTDLADMTSILPWLAGLLAGAGLGLAFFRGLWLTVRRLPGARHPALWVLASLLLRFALVLAGLFWVARLGGTAALVAAAVGFTLARLLLVRPHKPGRAGRGSLP